MSSPSLDQEALDRVYQRRFSEEDARKEVELWVEIVAYLDRFVPPGAAVLDIACDRGDFIRNVSAGERWASDIRDMSEYLPAARQLRPGRRPRARRPPAERSLRSRLHEQLPRASAVR